MAVAVLQPNPTPQQPLVTHPQVVRLTLFILGKPLRPAVSVGYSGMSQTGELNSCSNSALPQRSDRAQETPSSLPVQPACTMQHDAMPSAAVSLCYSLQPISAAAAAAASQV
jgi:hypothetical protein